jgi:hypothetical protein
MWCTTPNYQFLFLAVSFITPTSSPVWCNILWQKPAFHHQILHHIWLKYWFTDMMSLIFVSHCNSPWWLCDNWLMTTAFFISSDSFSFLQKESTPLVVMLV